MTRKCKACRAAFEPTRPMQAACGIECALKLAAAGRVKRGKIAATVDRRDTRAKLDKLKTRAEWAREAQAAFNSWVRLRDADQPCISCGRHHGGQYHAGHYLSVGARPELRFEPLNVHKQCAPCNTHLSGNAVLYRKALIVKIGLELVEWLEGAHPAKHYTTQDLAEIKKTYAGKVRELKKQEAA